MSTATKLVTADELFRMPDDGYRYELIEGELRKMSPPGSAHGFVTMEIASRLLDHVRRHQLGLVFAAETGFRITGNPDTVLAPDVSFVHKERVAVFGISEEYFPEAPALAVEVVSPGDTAYEVDDKMQRWFAAGVELGWVVYPKKRTITVYRGLNDIQVLKADDLLEGGEVLPGFTCRVGDVFVRLGDQ